MTTSLAKQLAARMKAKNITAAELEREAKLNSNAVGNILRGASKKPGAHVLDAIADILNCTVGDLLNKEGPFLEDISPSTNILDRLYTKHEDLLLDIVKLVNERHIGKALTIKQVLTCIEETFLHCVTKNPPALDREFVDWFMNLMTKPNNLAKH